MTDFTVARLYVYVAGNIIDPNQNNPNESNLYAAHNNAFHGSTGHTHDGTTGNGAPIVLQNAAASVTRQLGFSSGQPNYWDGSAVQQFITAQGDQTALGEKSFDSVNGIKLPNNDPTENRGVGFNNSLLEVFGTSLLRYPPREKDTVVVYNARMTYAAGEFKFVGDDGNDWSSSNPGIFRIYSQAAATFTEVIFTSSPTFQDATHGVDSDFVGSGTMSMGTVAAVAWASAMPLFWYVCTDGTTPLIGFSRLPHLILTGAGSNIGYKDNAPSAASQNNIIFLTASSPTATHNNKPLILIGSSLITKNSSDNWTFSAPQAGFDGINNFKNCSLYWDMPTAQNGGGGPAPAASRWFVPNGGTAPQFTTNTMTYRISLDGDVHVSFQFSGDGGVDGATAVNLALALPYSSVPAGGPVGSTVVMVRAGSVFVTWAAGANNQMTFPSIQNGTPTTCFFVRNTSATAVAFVQNADFTNGAREVSGDVRYPAGTD